MSYAISDPQGLNNPIINNKIRPTLVVLWFSNAPVPENS